MTWLRERGVDSPRPPRHLSPGMLRTFAYYFFAFAGFFAPRTKGGYLDA